MYNSKSNNGDENNYRSFDSNNDDDNNENQYSYYFSYLSGIYYSIKENLNTQSLIYISGKALEYVVYAGEKVYEKGVESLNYIRNKFHNGKRNFGGSYITLSNDDNFVNGGESLIDKSNNIFDV
jgi:hypothetical protein